MIMVITKLNLFSQTESLKIAERVYNYIIKPNLQLKNNFVLIIFSKGCGLEYPVTNPIVLPSPPNDSELGLTKENPA